MSGEKVAPEVVEARRRWVEALESGEYEQTKNALRNNDAFCCLGVACDLSALGTWEGSWYCVGNASSPSTLPSAVQRWLGVDDFCGFSVEDGNGGTEFLSGLNDAGWTFAELAAVIRERFGPDLDRVVR